MGEAAMMNLAEERTKMAAFVSEARIEIPEAAVCFSDPCPCCGNRKRRCLRPPSTPRKKRLLFHCNADPDAAGTSPAYSSSSTLTTPTSALSVGPTTSPTSTTSRVISPLVPLRIRASATAPTPTSASPPSLPSSSDHRLLERPNPGPDAPLVCGSLQAATEGPSNNEEEVRVRIKCRCGVVREVVLVG